MLEYKGMTICENCFSQVKEMPCRYCGYSGQPDITKSYALQPGIILRGNYIIGQILGKGGFGITYLAYDMQQDKRVAIKEFYPEGVSFRTTANPTVSLYNYNDEQDFCNGKDKFFEEAKTISGFNGHPNIVHVFEFFYENNTAYYVMEFVQGIDLKTFTCNNGGRLSEQQLLPFIDGIINALAAIHPAGVLHRDISPDNIFVTYDNNIKLLDFGAARQVIGEESKSLSVVLKQGFAPLEQYQSHGNQGPWTDLYALGATLYYCLVGEPPENVMSRIGNDTVPGILVGCNITPAMQAIIIKLLSINTDTRYHDVIALRRDINAIAHPEVPIQPNIGKINTAYEAPRVPQMNIQGNIPPAKPKRSNSGLIAVICVLAFVFIGSLTGVLIWSFNSSNTAVPSGGGGNGGASITQRQTDSYSYTREYTENNQLDNYTTQASQTTQAYTREITTQPETTTHPETTKQPEATTQTPTQAPTQPVIEPRISSASTLTGSVLESSNVSSERSFGADRAIDGNAESCWCVNTDADGGKGAQIRFDLRESATVSGIKIINGNIYRPEEDIYKSNGQIKSFTLTFSDGTSMSFTASYNGNASSVYEYFDFGASVTTSSITLTVTEAYIGAKYTTNVCLGEFEVY